MSRSAASQELTTSESFRISGSLNSSGNVIYHALQLQMMRPIPTVQNRLTVCGAWLRSNHFPHRGASIDHAHSASCHGLIPVRWDRSTSETNRLTGKITRPAATGVRGNNIRISVRHAQQLAVQRRIIEANTLALLSRHLPKSAEYAEQRSEKMFALVRPSPS
jgi:hypothetical protein